jgi:hypothetical protein
VQGFSSILYLLTVMLGCMLLSYQCFEQIFDAPTLAYSTCYALLFSVSLLAAVFCGVWFIILIRHYSVSECSRAQPDAPMKDIVATCTCTCSCADEKPAYAS